MKKTAQAFQGTVPKHSFQTAAAYSNSDAEPIDPFPDDDPLGLAAEAEEEEEARVEELAERIEARQTFALETLGALEREREAAKARGDTEVRFTFQPPRPAAHVEVRSSLLEAPEGAPELTPAEVGERIQEIQGVSFPRPGWDAGRDSDGTHGTEPDMVNQPPHYNQGKYNTAAVLDDWFPKDPHVWNAVKYLSRYMHKGKPVQDLEKAIWYIRRRIGVLQGDEEV